MTTSDKVYDAFHNKYFHGPTWLNITALQMAERDVPKDDELIKFQPAKLYNVYCKNELNYGIPVYKCVSINKMLDIFNIHMKSLEQILNNRIRSKTGRIREISNEYKIIPAGRTAAEYTFYSDTEPLVFHTISDAERRIGVSGKYINSCANKSQLCMGMAVTRRYVRLDVNGEVVEVIG